MYRREHQQEYEPSSQRKSSKKAGYVVRNAPWDQSQTSPPSTTDTKAFPAFGDAMDSNGPNNNNWGRN